MTLGETAVLTISPFVFVIFLGVPLAALFAALANEARYVLREHVLTNRQWFSDLAYGERCVCDNGQAECYLVECPQCHLRRDRIIASIIRRMKSSRAISKGIK